jgi:hypothetical protein
MDDVEHCWERLRNLIEQPGIDPRAEAAEVTRNFAAGAAQADTDRLRERLEHEFVQNNPPRIVPTTELNRYQRWLAIVEGARRGLAG